jgi:hypothetical protein
MNEEYQEFRNLKGAVWSTDLGRLERRLGALLADTALSFARGLFEASNQGLTAQTRDKFAQSLAALGYMWMISQGGCFNATTGKEEPYFAHPWPSRPRLGFLRAALVYGALELRIRYPDLTDAERDTLLGCVLGWLADALANEQAELKASLH